MNSLLKPYSPNPKNLRAYTSYVPIQKIRETLHMSWNRRDLSENPDISLEDIDEWSSCPNFVGDWDWFMLSMKLPMKTIRKNSLRPWVREGLSRNIELKLSDVKNDLKEKIYTGKWDLYSLSYLEGINCEIMLQWTSEDLFTSRWNMFYLSQTLPMDEIRAHPFLVWNRSGLSTNPGISLRDISFFNLRIASGTWSSLALASSVSMREIREDIRKQSGFVWYRLGLSKNPEITLEDIKNGIGVGDWEWSSLSETIPFEEIQKNLSSPNPYPWTTWGLIKNPGIKSHHLYMTTENSFGVNINGYAPLDRSDGFMVSRHLPIDEIRSSPHFSCISVSVLGNPGVTVADLRHLSCFQTAASRDIENAIEKIAP